MIDLRTFKREESENGITYEHYVCSVRVTLDIRCLPSSCCQQIQAFVFAVPDIVISALGL